MRVKNYFIAGSAAVIVTLFTSQLFATGVGLYGTYTKGEIESSVSNNDTDNEFDDNYDSSKIGVGFVLDTALAYDRLFNYRLHFGYAKVEFENKDFNFSVNGYELHFYNSFGFGVLRSEMIRLWLGPQIGLGYDKGEFDFPGSSSYFSFFVSYGIIAGINVNIGEAFTIGLDGGYRFERHVGSSKDSLYSYTFTGKGNEVFFDIAFMFRVGDTFSD